MILKSQKNDPTMKSSMQMVMLRFKLSAVSIESFCLQEVQYMWHFECPWKNIRVLRDSSGRSSDF